MKRDMDLVREILLAVEKHPHGFAPDGLALSGYSEEQIGYHAYLMGQAGLVNAAENTNLGSPSPCAIINNMTWEGHEFLMQHASRNDGPKQSSYYKKAGGASFKVWTSVLTDLVKSNLGIG